MIGAAMCGNFQKFPLYGDMVKLLWEACASCNNASAACLVACVSAKVRVDSSVPPVITPLKPKLWLLGSCTVPAQSCVQLK